jgi:hypothetical protein
MKVVSTNMNTAMNMVTDMHIRQPAWRWFEHSLMMNMSRSHCLFKGLPLLQLRWPCQPAGRQQQAAAPGLW